MNFKFHVEHKTDNLKNIKKETYISTEDFLVSGEKFDLLFDLKAEMLTTFPQPSQENLHKYYDSSSYISHTDSKEDLISFLYQWAKKRAIKKKLNLILKLNGGASTLLDIGAGTGDFLKKASEEGWIVNGVEPNVNARELAIKKNIQLRESIDDFSNEKFDVITLWHVLEHLPELEATIEKIEEILKPKGILIVAVPNYKSFDAKYYKNFWAGYDVPRHLWHFSKKSMVNLFSEKIKLQKIKPMIFDSFYVSLLSEKYKTANNFSLKSLFIGLASNIHAWKTKEYSSLIYCFKKAN